MKRLVLLTAALALVVGSGRASAQTVFKSLDADAWCRERETDSDRESHCEVREAAWRGRGESLSIDASPNGGIEVTGWDRPEIKVRAKVVAVADSVDEAVRLAAEVRIESAGTIHAEGPSAGRRAHWWVSYEAFVPRQSDVQLESTNGGIRLADVAGRISFRTTNGGVSLTRVAGDVQGRTTNGGVQVQLAGTEWRGQGLDVQTTNGGVTLTVPDDYNALLETGTTNGRLRLDFPMTVQGDIKQRVSARLGRGGAPVRVTTTNGGVTVRRP
jgi:hypothetical protein